MPVMSRLYSPADYGLLAIFTAVSSIVATAITLRYETAILLPKDDAESNTIVLLSLALALSLGLFFGVAAWLLPDKIRSLLGVFELGKWLPIAALAGLAGAVLATGSAWLNRHRAYVKMAQLRIAQSAVAALAGLCLGYSGVGSGLMLAQLIALAVGCAFIATRLLPLLGQWNRRSMVDAGRKHHAAPRFLLPTALLDVVTMQLPVLLITAWFSSEAAGQFSMAWRILALPMALVGSAIGQVFFQRISSDVHVDMRLVLRRYVRVSLLLGGVAIFPMLLVASNGEEIFQFVLGHQWSESGRIAELLVISMSMYFVFSPTSSVLLALGKQNTLLGFSLFQLAYRILAAFISDDVMSYVKILVIFEFVNVVIFELFVFFFIRLRIRRGIV